MCYHSVLVTELMRKKCRTEAHLLFICGDCNFWQQKEARKDGARNEAA
jgi:hypothetical protein